MRRNLIYFAAFTGMVDAIVDATELGVWALHCQILTHAESPDGMTGTVTALIVEK